MHIHLLSLPVCGLSKVTIIAGVLRPVPLGITPSLGGRGIEKMAKQPLHAC